MAHGCTGNVRVHNVHLIKVGLHLGLFLKTQTFLLQPVFLQLLLQTARRFFGEHLAAAGAVGHQCGFLYSVREVLRLQTLSP